MPTHRNLSVEELTEDLLSRKPTLRPRHNTGKKSIKSNKTKLRPNNDESSDIINLMSNFKSSFDDENLKLESMRPQVKDILTCMEKLLKKQQKMEEKINELEEKLSTIESNSITMNLEKSNDSHRLDDLEFDQSERQRSDRLLEIQISHPKLNHKSKNLKAATLKFLKTELKMPAEKIDPNCSVSTNREHSILMKVNDFKFKKNLFAMKKELKLKNDDIAKNLYVQDNLTKFNYNLFRKLKDELKRRRESNIINFYTVFSLNGKIFAKLTKDSEIMYIKNQNAIESFLKVLRENNPA